MLSVIIRILVFNHLFYPSLFGITRLDLPFTLLDQDLYPDYPGTIVHKTPHDIWRPNENVINSIVPNL